MGWNEDRWCQKVQTLCGEENRQRWKWSVKQEEGCSGADVKLGSGGCCAILEYSARGRKHGQCSASGYLRRKGGLLKRGFFEDEESVSQLMVELGWGIEKMDQWKLLMVIYCWRRRRGLA